MIREVRLAYPSILSDRQSLGHALAAVLAERRRAAWTLDDIGMNYFEASGGILDYAVMDDGFRRAMDEAQSHRDGLVDRPVQGRWSVLIGRGRLEP